MRHASLSLLLGAAALAACTGAEPAPEPVETSDDAIAIADEAVAATALAADVSDFLVAGLAWDDALFGPGGIVFAAPGCTGAVSIGPGSIHIEGDCTTPSGRHVAGTLDVGLGGCGFPSFTVEAHLITESSPGANDEVQVDAVVSLRREGGRTYVGANVYHRAFEHEHQVAGCVVRDGLILAADAHVSRKVSGSALTSVDVDDLQLKMCETVPYTGLASVETQVASASVEFSRPEVSRARIVATVNGQTTDVTVPVLGCTSNIPTPLAIDYATCGGCAVPPDPDPPGGDDDGGGDEPIE